MKCRCGLANKLDRTTTSNLDRFLCQAEHLSRNDEENIYKKVNSFLWQTNRMSQELLMNMIMDECLAKGRPPSTESQLFMSFRTILFLCRCSTSIDHIVTAHLYGSFLIDTIFRILGLAVCAHQRRTSIHILQS